MIQAYRRWRFRRKVARLVEAFQLVAEAASNTAFTFEELTRAWERFSDSVEAGE